MTTTGAQLTALSDLLNALTAIDCGILRNGIRFSGESQADIEAEVAETEKEDAPLKRQLLEWAALDASVCEKAISDAQAWTKCDMNFGVRRVHNSVHRFAKAAKLLKRGA